MKPNAISTAALLTLLTVVVSSGCFSGFESEGLLDEQPSATGLGGQSGRFGVERTRLYLGDPLGSGFDVEVTVPIGEGAHYTPVVVVQGGSVAKERYRWISEHLSTRGFTVLNAQHPFDLAILDVETSLRALDAAKAEPQLADRIADVPGAVIGHSLGGVVGAKVWNLAGAEELKHLVMLASLPDEADTFEADADADRIVLSVWGTKNGRTTGDEFFAGSRAFVDAARVYTATIEGMNHYQFVSDPTEGELANDGVAEIDIESAQLIALELIDRVCDDAAGTRAFQAPPDSAWPEGVETFGE